MVLTRLNPDIWTVSHVLTPAECEEFIVRAESEGFEAAAARGSSGGQLLTSIRNNDRLAFEDPELAERLWARVQPFVPGEMDGCPVSGLWSFFRVYRYDRGQRFKSHRDGRETAANGDQSRFSFLVYLNDGCEGGETAFREPGAEACAEIRIDPEAGMGLFFLHERRHEGSPVLSGRKYVLRSDVLYRRSAAQDTG